MLARIVLLGNLCQDIVTVSYLRYSVIPKIRVTLWTVRGSTFHNYTGMKL